VRPRPRAGAGARLRCRTLALLAAGAAVIAGAQPTPESTPAYEWHLPRGFPTPAVPADNPMSDAKVALGRRLFFEPRLSITGHYSCASCHDPARAFSDGRPVAVGATGEALPHNAMALINVAYNLSFGWTKPQLRSLEAQMLEPMLNEQPVELGMKGRESAVSADLASDPGYAHEFAAAFPTEAAPVSFTNLVKAIGAFERTLISGGSPFDRYVFAGEHAALSPQAKRGMAVFFSPRAGCAGCHSGFNFSGNWRDTAGPTGRASFARNGTSSGAMRVPTLRNVALSAPYMHDGRFATLEAVLEHYSAIGARLHATAALTRGSFGYDPRLPHSPFSAAERAELVSFLESLTDESFVTRFAANPAGATPARE
jgi:cytochrome c peroxidase